MQLISESINTLSTIIKTIAGLAYVLEGFVDQLAIITFGSLHLTHDNIAVLLHILFGFLRLERTTYHPVPHTHPPHIGCEVVVVAAQVLIEALADFRTEDIAAVYYCIDSVLGRDSHVGVMCCVKLIHKGTELTACHFLIEEIVNGESNLATIK